MNDTSARSPTSDSKNGNINRADGRPDIVRGAPPYARQHAVPGNSVRLDGKAVEVRGDRRALIFRVTDEPHVEIGVRPNAHELGSHCVSCVALPQNESR